MKTGEERQNITLALPKRLLRRVKVAAAERDTSISAILVGLLEDFLRHNEDGYEKARRHAVSVMDKGYDLVTHGKRTWTREEMHER